MSLSTLYPTIKPSLNLDFANTKRLDPRITFVRATTGTYYDSNGVMQTAPANVARFDHDPVTGESLGLLIEEQRSNLLLNSAVLLTQDVTVSAASHTLTFFGTGTITLSGTHEGALVGTGTGTRVSLIFTPTAGTLTLTVSGSCAKAQLEAGAFATSYIETSSAQVTRAADSASMTGTNFSSWYRQDEGTILAEQIPLTTEGNNYAALTLFQSDTSKIVLGQGAGTTNSYAAFWVAISNVDIAFFASATVAPGIPLKSVGAYKQDDFAACFNGAAVQVDSSGNLLAPTEIKIGRGTSDIYPFRANGRIKKIVYYPKRLANDQLQALTS